MAATAKDPVCGMQVDPAKAAQVQHEGKTYSFCSTGCARRFEADPRRFLDGGPQGMGDEREGDYTPLVVVLLMILLVTLALAYLAVQAGTWRIEATLGHFMAGFFLTFAAFKLMDLRGFAEGYATYDLLARRLPAYGYVYPFIELAFGLGMVLDPTNQPLLLAEVAVMTFSGMGVVVKLVRKEPFRCACLGTFLKVPLTTVTLVEDFGMAALGIVMLAIA